MAADSALPKRFNRQTSLRSLFGWTFCVAAGFTVGARGRSPSVDWYQALLSAASVAIAIGLVRQAFAIRRYLRGAEAITKSVRFAVRFESAWRLMVATLLVFWLLVQLALNRGYVEFPDSEAFFEGDVLTTYPWWLLLLISLGEAASRKPTAAAPGPRRRWIGVLVWAGMGLFGLYVIIDKTLIAFLVHLATRGVDATLVHTGNRYPLWTPLEQTQFALLAAAAVAAVLGATILLGRALVMPSARRARRRATAALGSVLLAAAAGYSWWYYGTEYPAVSPDLAGAGLAANWLQLLGGAVLAAFLAAIGAARITKLAGAREIQSDTLEVDLPPAGESVPVIVLLGAAVSYYLVQMIRSALVPSPLFDWYHQLAYLLIYPETAFIIAMGTLLFQLGRLRWKGQTAGPLRLAPFSPWRFLAAWLALVAVLAVGVPTLAAFSFSFWLGPWYRW